MKNIHLLLAGESRLSLNRSYRDYAIGTEAGEPYWTYSQYKHHMSVTDASVRPHNMYITSDEEIKEGDWYLTSKNTICKCIKTDSKYVYSLEGGSSTNCKKIILTTDQALIKDGVWGIEDGFLEWFVKNPTCEYVELKGYAIILPGESCDCDKMCSECEAKQEPGKETADYIDRHIVEALVEVAKQKMYSEEEVEDLIYKVCGTVARLQGITLNGNHIDTAYKKFKKK